ncbi:MAG TPA: ribosome-associated translation inhibitor RaiA [Caulobacteraceae bacterium]|nr:ribosome-associated translation inhibitor RaiA [Caulobacteraceae bacterium]
MQVLISGKHVDLGEALRSRITDELSGSIGKYFERGGDAEVVVTKEGHLFRVDALVRLASGQQLHGHSYGGDAHGAFDGLLEKIEKRVRRYKRKLKNHHVSNGKSGQETAPVTVLRAPDDHDDDGFGEEDDAGVSADGPPVPMVIAETESPIRTMTVSMAVLELDLTHYPVLLFRNAAHGGLSLVYRRPDGNIGWIDPERTRSGNGHANGG